MLEIRTPALQRLYQDWEDRRRRREFPARSDFDVLDLKYLIGNLALIEVAYDPLRFRFRLHGSAISERVGYEMTGKGLDDIPAREVRDLIRKHFVAVIESRRPIVQSRDRLMVDNLVLHCEVLALPLAADGRTIDMLLTGMVWL